MKVSFISVVHFKYRKYYIRSFIIIHKKKRIDNLIHNWFILNKRNTGQVECIKAMHFNEIFLLKYNISWIFCHKDKWYFKFDKITVNGTV